MLFLSWKWYNLVLLMLLPELSSSGQDSERAFKNSFWNHLFDADVLKHCRKCFPQCHNLSYTQHYNPILTFRAFKSALALCILCEEISIFSFKKEGTVIHMVRDPVTVQNEEIILQMAVESSIYVTERSNTLQYVTQNYKLITFNFCILKIPFW